MLSRFIPRMARFGDGQGRIAPLGFTLVVLMAMLLSLAPLSRGAPPSRALLPELLSQILQEGAASLEKDSAAFKAEADALLQELRQAEEDLQLLRAQVANLKASQVAGDLPLRQAEEVLAGFAQRDRQVATRLNALQEKKEQWAKQLEERSKALEDLKKQVEGLKTARHPLWGSPRFRQTWERYQQLGKQYQANATQLLARREQVIKILTEERQLLAEVLADLKAYLDKGWKEELWKRQTWASFWQTARETWGSLRAAPEQLSSQLKDPLVWQRLAATLESHWPPILGLLVLFILVARLARQGRRVAEAALLQWQQEAPNMAAKVLFTAGGILAHHLLSLGLAVWVLLLLWVVGWWETRGAGLLVLSLFVWLVLHLGLHFLQRLFAGAERGGVFPLDAATARFYRRHLKLIWIYGWVLGGWCLPVLSRLGLEGPACDMLGEIFQIGLLVYILYLLRRRYLEALRTELPGPEWAKGPGFFMVLRVLLVSVLGAIALSSLLGFHYLSAVIAKAATVTGLSLALFWLLWQSGLALLEHFLKAGPREEKVLPEQEERLKRYYLSALRAATALGAGGAVLLLLRIGGVPFQLLQGLFQGLTLGPRLGPFHLSPANLFFAFLILLLGRWLSGFLRTFLEARFYPRVPWDESLRYTVSSILHYAILSLAILLALGSLGVAFTDLAIVAGGLGIGIGFGLQNIVNNFISGLILLFERPIKVGDLLVIDGQWGVVREIRVRSTIFQTFDRSVLIIPNSELLSSKILNWTHYGSGVNRLTLKVGVSYGSDVRKVTRILEEVCRSNPRVLPEPPPQIFFEAYGDSSLNFNIWVHLGSPADRIPAIHELNSAIFEAFREQGIEIPFPQRDLHLKSWPGSPPGVPPSHDS